MKTAFTSILLGLAIAGPPCHPSAGQVGGVARVDPVAPVDKADRAIVLRADPVAAIPPLADRAENAARAVRVAPVVRADLVEVDSDLQPSRSRRNKSD